MVLEKGPAGPKPHKLVWCWMGGCNSLNPIRVVWYRKGGEGLQLPEFYGKMGKRPRGFPPLWNLLNEGAEWSHSSVSPV